MGAQLRQFRLYAYTCAGVCRHDLLLRVERPGHPNHDQGAEDAADAFAESAADHLRAWWQRWILSRACRGDHESRLTRVLYDTVSDDLDGPGPRELRVWEAVADGEPIIGAAATEEGFWREVEAYYAPDAPPVAERRATGRTVFFLTGRSGEGDLRDLG